MIDAALIAIGERLRDAREHRGISQHELGRRVGCARSTVSNLEAGRFAPSVRMLLAISEALNITFIIEVPARENDAPA